MEENKIEEMLTAQEKSNQELHNYIQLEFEKLNSEVRKLSDLIAASTATVMSSTAAKVIENIQENMIKQPKKKARIGAAEAELKKLPPRELWRRKSLERNNILYFTKYVWAFERDLLKEEKFCVSRLEEKLRNGFSSKKEGDALLIEQGAWLWKNKHYNETQRVEMKRLYNEWIKNNISRGAQDDDDEEESQSDVKKEPSQVCG